LPLAWAKKNNGFHVRKTAFTGVLIIQRQGVNLPFFRRKPSVIFLALATPSLADGQGCSAALHPDPKGETTMTATTVQKPDVYARVTSKIIESLEAGVRPWLKPWSGEHAAGRITRPLRSNGIPYRGVNVLLLWADAVEKGYVSPFWMTYKQAAEMKAHVRKGEHGSLVVYADTIHRTETDEATGQDVEKDIPFMKGYTVFNVEQIEGLPEHYYAKPATPLPACERLEHADSFFRGTYAEIRTGGNRAFYAIGDDYIQMPPFEAFKDAESYAATLAHELTHWTRHPKRLDRDLGRKQWGDEGYAKEELVAEMGSAFLCSDLGLTPALLDDHAAYIAFWLEVLKNDKRFIFTAASHAQKAADYLHSLQNYAAPPVTTETAA
jgi:antirestriction protein ArdC